VPERPMPRTKSDLMAHIDAGWDQLQAAIGQLTEAQLTGPRSEDGWTVKDHLAHIAAWEASAVAILTGQPRHVALGVDEATYAAGFEAVNAAVQAANRDRPLPDVLAGLGAVHRDLLDALGRRTEDELFVQTYARYMPAAPGEPDEFPVVNWIIGNTYEHYEEHVPWRLAIVDSGA
jgi:hypothetical protein